jgi:DNA invertase Pin-like site-specific DNA recombinase
MRKAYSYIRFSTQEQAKGNSLERQLNLSKEYAERNGLILDQNLSMRDLGLSGFKRTNITKGALGDFLRAVESGIVEKGSFFLVESLDRISRAEITEQMSIFLNLINAGITIVTLIDGISYTKEDIDKQMNDLLYSLMIMSRGHEESLTKSKRLKASWESKRKRTKDKFITTIRPAWLDFDKTIGDFIENKARCMIVREIFEMAGRGLGKDRIAKSLNISKIPTFGRSKNWHQSYIQKILQNRSVIGEFQPHRMLNGKRIPVGSPIEGYFPKIVTDEQFYSILKRRNALAKVVGRARTSNRNLFTGLLKCGYTGCSVVYVNKGKWQYLVSSNAMFGKNDIPYTSWAYKDFETSFFSLIKDLDISSILNPNSKIISSQYEAEVLILEEKNRILNNNINNLVDSISDGSAPKSIKEKILSLEEELENNKIKSENIKKLISNNIEIAKATEDSQKRTIELLDKLDDPKIRDEIRVLILQQVAKIDIFAGGKQVGKSLGNSLADMFFLNTPILTEKEKKEIQNENYDVFDKITEGWNDSLRVKDLDEEDGYEIEDVADMIPTDRKSRFFVVHFKTGTKRYVMPSLENPKKVKLAVSFDINQIRKTGFMVDLGLSD